MSNPEDIKPRRKAGRPKGAPNAFGLSSKFASKYKQPIINKVLSHIANGISVDELNRANPDIYPTSAMVGLMIEECTWFSDEVLKAKKVLAHRLVELLHDLRAHPPTTEAHTYDGKLDKSMYKISYDIWTKRLKSVQDELRELAPVYNKQYIKQTKTDVTTTNIEQVMVMNYADMKQPNEYISTPYPQNEYNNIPKSPKEDDSNPSKSH